MIDCLIPLGNLSTLNYNNVSTLAAILGNLYNCNFNTYVPTS